MAISLVELQGAIPRQHDFQLQKQYEDGKVLVDQNNYQIQGEKNTNEKLHQVEKQENTAASRDKNPDHKNSYHGDGGRNRKQDKREAVLKKTPSGGFDVKI